MMMPDDEYVQEVFLRTSEEKHRAVVESLDVTEAQMLDSINIIKDWCAQQPHFPKILFSDKHLRRIIQINKFSIEKSKQKIDNLLTARGQIPEIYGDRDPQGQVVLEGSQMMEFAILPSVTDQNRRVLLSRLKETDPSKFDPVKAYVYSVIQADMRSSIDTCEGVDVVLDYNHYTFQHFLKLTPTFAKKMVYLYESCYATRVSSVHALNFPAYGEFSLKLLKSLMKKKIRDRIYIHHSMEELYEHLPRKIFPKDMGGEEPQTFAEMADDWRQYILKSTKWREWLLMSSTITTDERKRPVDQESAYSEMAGQHGTFRKLDID